MNEKISVIFFYVKSVPIRFDSIRFDSVLKQLRIDASYGKASQGKVFAVQWNGEYVSTYIIFVEILWFTYPIPHTVQIIWNMEYGKWDSGLGTWDLGLGTWDLGTLGPWDLELRTSRCCVGSWTLATQQTTHNTSPGTWLKKKSGDSGAIFQNSSRSSFRTIISQFPISNSYQLMKTW